ncbi:MAG: PLP-dependent aminotransferase family protein [Actinomycetales bacterium]
MTHDSALENLLSARARAMTASTIREILKVTAQPDVISFAGGLPAPELFPVREVGQAAARVLDEYGPAALQYSTTEGHLPLREWIAAQSRTPQGRVLGPDNVQIVTGSQQGLDLLARILIDPGDTVLVESPTYLGALQAFSPFQPRFVSIPSDQDGLDVDALAAWLQDHRATLLYLVPNFANPTGRTLTLERRRALVELAARHGLLIIEDDPYGALRFRAEPLPNLHALSIDLTGDLETSLVVRCSSFSKTLAPGLREGWVQAAKPIIRSLVMAKQGADLHSPTLDQLIVTDLLADVLPRQIARVREVYAERAALMCRLLDELADEVVERSDPEGGMFCWVRVLDGRDTTELLDQAVRRKVAFVPGAPFYAGDDMPRDTLRLNFTNSSPDQLHRGMGILAELLTSIPLA